MRRIENNCTFVIIEWRKKKKVLLEKKDYCKFF